MPSVNASAEEGNIKKIDEKVSLEEENLKINESLQKKDEFINIPDINLKKALNETLNQAENADITKEQLENITKLVASNKNVNSIEGLQYCKNLKHLEVWNGQIND
ncbi:hypothetical protein GNF77_17150, partial [Clostridium perfringens]|nr:hypothetical protein [Clostridium perfringens]